MGESTAAESPSLLSFEIEAGRQAATPPGLNEFGAPIEPPSAFLLAYGAQFIEYASTYPAPGTLLRVGGVGRAMEALRDKATPHVRLLLMLLANLTASDRGCADLLQLSKPGMEGLHM